MSPASRYHEIAIGDLLGPLAGRDVAMLPNNGNLGDALIHAATLKALARARVAARIVGGAGHERAVVLLIEGGGNLIDRCEYLLPRLERPRERFKDFVILHHTICGARVGAAIAELEAPEVLRRPSPGAPGDGPALRGPRGHVHQHEGERVLAGAPCSRPAAPPGRPFLVLTPRGRPGTRLDAGAGTVPYN
jgi:hypothetical protein